MELTKYVKGVRYRKVMIKRSKVMGKREKPFQLINVKKSNTLIQSIGKTTLLSSKVFLTALYKIENRAGVREEIKPYYERLEKVSGTDFTKGLVSEFTNVELRAIMGTNSGSYYSKIADLMDPQSPNSLRNQWVIMIKNPEDGLYGVTDVITSTVYDEKEGKLYIKFSGENKIQKELFNLKTNYTLLNYNLMMQFKSIYTYRIYELLMSRIGYLEGVTKEKKPAYSFSYNLSELKYLLGILDPYITKEVRNALSEPHPDFEKIEAYISTERIMPRYNEFKKYTLVKAKKEIDENPLTEFTLDFEPIRNGRGGKVVGVELIMTRKNRQEEILQATEKVLTEEMKDEIIDSIQQLISYPLSIRDLRAIAVAANYQYEKICQAYEVLEANRSEIDNVVGFLIAAIKHDYEKPKKKLAKNQFNQFQQNSYDFDVLEQEILSN